GACLPPPDGDAGRRRRRRRVPPARRRPGRRDGGGHDRLPRRVVRVRRRYVAGLEGAEVTPRCCKGLSIIKDLATTAEQRRELCEYVHLVMIAGGRVIPRRGQLLRTACGFSVDFLPTNFYFNCSRLPVRTLVCIYHRSVTRNQTLFL
ncbi:hypothetical protein CFC21_096143, partial [Triticum aestivum]